MSDSDKDAAVKETADLKLRQVTAASPAVLPVNCVGLTCSMRLVVRRLQQPP